MEQFVPPAAVGTSHSAPTEHTEVHILLIQNLHSGQMPSLRSADLPSLPPLRGVACPESASTCRGPEALIRANVAQTMAVKASLHFWEQINSAAPWMWQQEVGER